jgi:TonB family protein
MFDRLIVSEQAGVTKNRSGYFAFSSLFVGVTVALATVISIFAADYGLGTDTIEVSSLLTPVAETPRTEPEIPRQQPLRSQSRPTSALPVRTDNIQNLRETPVSVPREVATTASTAVARPDTPYAIGRINSDPAPGGPVSINRGSGNGDGPGLVASDPAPVRHETAPESPAAAPPAAVRPVVTKSLGVINGIARSLPKPNYPAAAIAANIEGKVDVQVLIDETGRVVSAKAVSGNPMLKSAAEQAARNARFSPTILSNVPVKVTGVIIYNFNRG